MEALPTVGMGSVVSILTDVVLSAPVGPNNPKRSPANLERNNLQRDHFFFKSIFRTKFLYNSSRIVNKQGG